jgi:hypothetical protein
MKICQVGAELSQSDGQRVVTNPLVNFSQFCEGNSVYDPRTMIPPLWQCLFNPYARIWRLAGGTSNITCNYLYCNYQVHRDCLITLYNLFFASHENIFLMFLSLFFFFFAAVKAVFVTEMQGPGKSPYLAFRLVECIVKYVTDLRVNLFTYLLNRLAMYFYPSIIFYVCLQKKKIILTVLNQQRIITFRVSC